MLQKGKGTKKAAEATKNVAGTRIELVTSGL
jgi:hypothetical protein